MTKKKKHTSTASPQCARYSRRRHARPVFHSVLPPPCFPLPSAGTAEVGYAVVQRRRRARSPDVTFSTSASAPVYDLDGIAVSLSNTNRFVWIAVRVLVQRKSMELPTRIVVGFYKKGGSSARISIRSVLDKAFGWNCSHTNLQYEKINYQIGIENTCSLHSSNH